MSISLPVAPTISQAWNDALQATLAVPSGQRSHVLMTVTEPGSELPGVRQANDDFLNEANKPNRQSVSTVASTIFPVDLYPVPPVAWNSDLSLADKRRLDAAAETLYTGYARILPLLLTADGNKFGTYFQRMVSYPGPGPGGFNQLDTRIKAIRSASRRVGQGNYFNLDLAADGDPDQDIDAPTQIRGGSTAASDRDAVADMVDPTEDAHVWGGGLQLLRPQDKRSRGFPCLVHIDLTMEASALHLFAVYRRQNLITKSYGNLFGLSRLQAFICQQTGLQIGRLSVMATFADAEHDEFGKRRVAALAEKVAAITSAAEQTESEQTEAKST
jgi:hypothetical protein